MRVLLAIALLALAGCTAPYVQPAPPASPTTAPAGATDGSGQGPVVGRSISPAGGKSRLTIRSLHMSKRVASGRRTIGQETVSRNAGHSR